MKLIVGLGNPGRSYAGHRHNIGFWVLCELARRHGIDIARRSFGALVGNGTLCSEAVILAKPQTFMNLSGDAVAPLFFYYKLTMDELVVVHDDLDLALGQLKISVDAGAAGHNGVASIIEAVGGKGFCRVRVGIGRPPAGISGADYVLSDFGPDEESGVEGTIGRAADAVEMLIRDGVAATQQRYH